VLCADIGSQLRFEFFDFRPHDVLAVGKDLLNVPVKLFFDASLLCSQINEIHQFAFLLICH